MPGKSTNPLEQGYPSLCVLPSLDGHCQPESQTTNADEQWLISSMYVCRQRYKRRSPLPNRSVFPWQERNSMMKTSGSDALIKCQKEARLLKHLFRDVANLKSLDLYIYIYSYSCSLGEQSQILLLRPQQVSHCTRTVCFAHIITGT